MYTRQVNKIKSHGSLFRNHGFFAVIYGIVLFFSFLARLLEKNMVKIMISYLVQIQYLQTFNRISTEQLIEIERSFNQKLQNYWYDQNFLTPEWWLLVILSILSPIIWWKFIDRKRITEITLFGLFYGTAAIILDSIGSNALIWTYPVSLTPYLYPQIYPYDVGVVIVPFMFVYQKWGHNFKKYLVFSGVLSIFLAFVAEQVMEWLNIYKELKWSNSYSMPIYWLLGIICWGIVKKFKKLEHKQT